MYTLGLNDGHPLLTKYYFRWVASREGYILYLYNYKVCSLKLHPHVRDDLCGGWSQRRGSLYNITYEIVINVREGHVCISCTSNFGLSFQ